MNLVALAQPMLAEHGPFTSYADLKQLVKQIIARFITWEKFSCPSLRSCPNLSSSATIELSTAPEVEAILDTETTHVEAILDQETTHKKVRGPEEDKEVCEAAEVLLNAQEAPQEEVEGGNPEPEKRRVEGVEDKYLEYVQGWFTFMSFLE